MRQSAVLATISKLGNFRCERNPFTVHRVPFTVFLLSLSLSFSLSAQEFTRQDTLRGSITPERAWWDLVYYHLDIAVNPDQKTVIGKNTIQYRVLEPASRMQIDLQPPMKIHGVSQNGKSLAVERDGNAWFISLEALQEKGTLQEVVVEYGGHPTVAKRAPWDGGFSWAQDGKGKHFVATSCQGEGASMWWPCKDHMYDEPDSMLISVNVPADLTNVSNGRLREVESFNNGTKTFHWFVSNPISNYVVNVNIGDYVHFSEVYAGEKGQLDCDYYVLRDNLDTAKVQFKEVPRMLDAFEHWFGPYPFYEDGFKLVEVPYLGMEHQSSITYGNGYQNGYRGTDLSDSGWGLKFDFIIIHESGHEWFANNITYKDIADMWIHESFTAYSENLFLDYHFGSEAADAYTIGTRLRIGNQSPIIGPYNVNQSGSGDMYYKGANMLLTLRQVVNDDEKWRNILRGLNQEFYHQTVTTEQVEEFISTALEMNLEGFFDQYLRDIRIPVLEYQVVNGQLRHRWQQTVSGFRIPVRLWINGEEKWITPSAFWSVLPLESETEEIKFDPRYYIIPYQVLGD